MQHRLELGAVYTIKDKFLKRFKLIYCGMPDKDIFVVSPMITQGYQGFSPMIYYDASSKLIWVYDRGFTVIEVHREYLVLQH